jgi:hypothetical protein
MGLPAYRAVVAVLRDTDERLSRLEKERESVRGKNPAVDRGVDEMVREHRRLLEYGAATRLGVAGELVVLPPDDEDLLGRARPVRPDGTARVDPTKVEARHDGLVKAALASGPVAVIVLGGSHDLSGSVRRHGGWGCEYIWVTTAAFRRIAGQ